MDCVVGCAQQVKGCEQVKGFLRRVRIVIHVLCNDKSTLGQPLVNPCAFLLYNA